MSEIVAADATIAWHSGPPITIGMPIYNGAAYVEEALAALLEQTYRNFTLLISDNASDDGTWDILRKWTARDRRIVLHRQETNIGMVRNFSYVVDQAKTEYFLWHCHDDWLEPNYLEELVDIITSDAGCALAVSGVKRFAADKGFLKYRTYAERANAKRGRRDIMRMVRKPQTEWVYGLFRTAELRAAVAAAQEFGYAWSFDHIVTLPFILNDQIRGTDRTHFNRSKLNQSKSLYCPKIFSERVRFLWLYTKLHFRILFASRAAWPKKLLYIPVLLSRIHETNGVLNLKRWINYQIRRYIKAPMQKARAAMQVRSR